jgi:hypothetical protein
MNSWVKSNIGELGVGMISFVEIVSDCQHQVIGDEESSPESLLQLSVVVLEEFEQPDAGVRVLVDVVWLLEGVFLEDELVAVAQHLFFIKFLGVASRFIAPVASLHFLF